MQMNALIPMQVQSPDLVGSMARGVEAARMANTAGRENALANLYRTQGAGMMAGDRNALNALAQHDPAAALGIQSAHQDMALGQKRLDVLTAQERRAAEEYARGLSAEQAQAEAAKIEQGVKMGMAAQSPQQWDALMRQYAPDLVGQFDSRQMLASKYMGWADILKGGSDKDRYKVVGNTLFDLAAEGGPQAVGQGQGSQRTVYDANGNVVYQEGGAPPKLSVDAGKNTGFYMRTIESNKVLDDLEAQGTNFWQQNAEHVPFGLGNYARTPEFQRYDQARRDFVNAILRRESGAVISDQEFENANKQYFPTPGDSQEVIAQKRRNRETAIAGLRVGSAEGAAYADSIATHESPQPVRPQAKAPDFSAMTDDELNAWIAENSK